MIRDIIDRFAYRLELWTREQDEGRLGAGGGSPVKRIYRKDESIFQMTIRYVGVTAMSVTIFAIIGRNIIRFFPSSAFGVFVVLAIFILIWIFCGVTIFVGEYKAKKELGDQNGTSRQTK